MVIFIILSIKAAFFFCFPRDHNFGSTMQPYVSQKSQVLLFSGLFGGTFMCCTVQQDSGYSTGRLGSEWRFSYRVQPVWAVVMAVGCFLSQLWAAVHLRLCVCGEDRVLLCSRSKNKQALQNSKSMTQDQGSFSFIYSLTIYSSVNVEAAQTSFWQSLTAEGKYGLGVKK